ncbi:hypothetical protein Z950_249 [Sulfitobacter mediterraneus KCTC 32188]|nr:hypothetical protein Z950_249 [Sulfitobacter mediterraneus KCTC 32188]
MQAQCANRRDAGHINLHILTVTAQKRSMKAGRRCDIEFSIGAKRFSHKAPGHKLTLQYT